MIDTVIAVEIAGFCEENTHGFSQLYQLIGIAADTNYIAAEVADIRGHRFGSVSLRVNTDQDDSRELASGFDDPRSRDCKLLQRCRANVRAMREAKENNTPSIWSLPNGWPVWSTMAKSGKAAGAGSIVANST